MKLRIQTFAGKLIKRDERGFRSALAWYNSEAPEIEITTNTAGDTAYQLLSDDFKVAIVQFCRGSIVGFRFISDDGFIEVMSFTDNGPCSPNMDKHLVLEFEYLTAELTESMMQLRHKQTHASRVKSHAV